jgi:hypothetical protein
MKMNTPQRGEMQLKMNVGFLNWDETKIQRTIDAIVSVVGLAMVFYHLLYACMPSAYSKNPTAIKIRTSGLRA